MMMAASSQRSWWWWWWMAVVAACRVCSLVHSTTHQASSCAYYESSIPMAFEEYEIVVWLRATHKTVKLDGADDDGCSCTLPVDDNVNEFPLFTVVETFKGKVTGEISVLYGEDYLVAGEAYGASSRLVHLPDSFLRDPDGFLAFLYPVNSCSGSIVYSTETCAFDSKPWKTVSQTDKDFLRSKAPSEGDSKEDLLFWTMPPMMLLPDDPLFARTFDIDLSHPTIDPSAAGESTAPGPTVSMLPSSSPDGQSPPPNLTVDPGLWHQFLTYTAHFFGW